MEIAPDFQRDPSSYSTMVLPLSTVENPEGLWLLIIVPAVIPFLFF
jgi:hypothetical protein